MRDTRLYLNVPYAEKDEAKGLGARWDPERKQWYVTYNKNYHLFKKWFFYSDTNLIIYDYLYIAVANRECFRCKHQTPVISLASDTIIDIRNEYEDDEDEYEELLDNEVYFIYEVDILPIRLEKYLKDTYNFYYGYSKFADAHYYGNHCIHCGVLQGNFELHGEPTSPFCISNVEDAKDITLLKLKLDKDLELSCSLSWSSPNNFLKQYSEIKDLVIL